jgi:hypothetical protein
MKAFRYDHWDQDISPGIPGKAPGYGVTAKISATRNRDDGNRLGGAENEHEE